MGRINRDGYEQIYLQISCTGTRNLVFTKILYIQEEVRIVLALLRVCKFMREKMSWLLLDYE